MKLIREPVSLSAKFDYVLLQDNMVAIVDLKKAGTNCYSLWWVAGLTSQNRLSVAYQAQFALSAGDMNSAEEKITSVSGSIFEIARDSLDSGGVKPIPLLDDHATPRALASTFLFAFESQGLFQTEGMELNVSAGLQYEFCQLLKVSKPVEFLAEYLKVPVGTMRQRLTWARNKGVIPKLRESKGDEIA